ncbi:MAG: hypothetical protein V7786_01825 [Sulfitobacter litoralis]|uniref:hypothetical protein n=1 Tax=Sulfitobacter litoralis TaxID=335975 RepID=UPI003000FE37
MSSAPGNIIDAVERFEARSVSRMEEGLPDAPEATYDGGNGGGDGMDPNERMNSIERAQIQAGMDLAYIKGKLEDMPTKDWFNMRLLAVFGGIAVFTGLGLTLLGVVLSN